MRSLIHDFAGKASRAGVTVVLLLTAGQAASQGKVTVPTQPLHSAHSTDFRDKQYGVRFQVPPGWDLARKDRQVSTFRLDARSAPAASAMRGVVSLAFNPFPGTVLSGALVYFSVAKHSDDKMCADQASSPAPAMAEIADHKGKRGEDRSSQNIGGMEFTHGHDEHGGICVEARDEVYTAFRKGSCYRFDLTVNTFCSVTSGAADLSREQMRSLEAQMVGILSTVTLDWEKTGPQQVPVPEIAGAEAPALPRPSTARQAVGTGTE